MHKNLLYGFWTILTFTGILLSSASFGQATLKHSYTFEEGTYEGTTIFDQSGSLDGTMVGSAISIADGKCVVSGATSNTDGYVVFDGVALNLASYNAVSLEAFIETGEVLNTSYTMLAYFGSTTQGQNCFWIQPTRAATETRIEANNGSTTITALLNGYEVDDGEKHHLVAILSPEALIYYLDGIVIARASTEGADYISTLGTDIAQLFKGPDGWADPNYNCWLEEFNIYDGVLDQSTIATRAGNYLGLDMTNALLDTVSFSVGSLDPTFDFETDIYELTVPYGTTSVTVSATPEVGGAGVTIIDGLGTEITDGVVTIDKDDGNFIEIVVTAIDQVSEMSYYVDIYPTDGAAAATLASIDLSAGNLTTNFHMDETSYVAIVPPGTTSVDVTAVPNWDMATVEGDGTITLADGVGSATITVTSEDGTTAMTYTVEVHASIFESGTDYYLVHELSNLVAAESGASFNQAILADAVYQDNAQIWQFVESGVDDQYYIQNKAGNYMCLSRTSANIWDLEVYPDLPEIGLDSARFMVNEFEPGRFRIISVARQQVSATNNILGPNNGELNSALFNDKWRSAANDPLTVFNLKFPEDVVSEYDLHLADLTINGVTFKPAFNPAYITYYATIPPNVTSVEVTATPRDTITPPTITGTGTVDVSDDEGTITVTVTAAADPQYTRVYTIHYISDTELTLAHSYTFDDGTALDQIGNAHGTVHGGTFADSSFIAGKEGDYIILPAGEIAINTYPSVTLEAHVLTGANPGWTMLAYFGGSSGTNSYWMSIARNDNISRTEINTGGSVFANGVEPGVGEIHHYVSVLSNDTIFWYIDGSLAAKTATASHSMISNISTAGAWIGYGGYSDPTWLGTIYEFNIYSGQMDAATVAARAQQYFGGISIDATLASLTVDVGELIPAFNPDVKNYSVIVPEGTTTVNVSAVPNDQKSTVEGTGAIDVSSGSGSAAVVVTAENGSTITYNIGFSTPEEFTLMHSYTFDDGTAADVVGGADGTLIGNGTIANGAYTAAANGDYIELPAANIAINTYSAITLEGYIFADVDNTAAVMLAYFGGNENGVGGNGYFLTPDRWSESRTAISCGNITEPWNAEQGVTGPPVSVGEKHHVVSVLTDSSIKWYIDGLLIGEAVVSGNNSIAGLSNANAWLCKGGYDADPTWMGTIHEFNIYAGAMDAATISQHANKFLGGLTKMHSYTFEDGTATDVVGNADGVLMGNGTIADGAYTAAANGDYIELPAADIAINTYSAITLEGYIFADVDNTAAVMMAYFGGNENGVGGNGYFLTPDRWNESRTAISCGNITEPWTAEQGVTGPPVSVGAKHHVVSVLTDSSITWYIDGELVGEAEVSGDNSIANLSTANAWLCKGGYDADPTWMGTIHEFNIYEGAMDAATVLEHAKQFLGEESRDASLSALTVDVGVMGPQFNPEVTTYYVTVPEGTTSMIVTATSTDANASVVGGGAVDVSSGSGSVAVVVTAEDGTTVITYNIEFSTPGELTKMHSYTFEDGTAADVVGDAHGTLMGNGTIANGTYTSAADGDYIELPAATIAINTYSAITLEAYVTPGVNNGWTMLAYFGSMGGWPSYWMSIARADDVSMTTVDAGHGAFGTSGPEPAAGETHHYVSVLTDSAIFWYIDGVMVSSATTPENTTIAGITTDVALLCRGGYPDPSWIGDIHEFNIYEGAMDAITVAERYNNFVTAVPDIELDKANIKVYPTYSTGHFNVETNGSSGMITVYNLTGKLVLQKKIESNLEAVTVSERGMYIMKVDSEGASKSFKIFKTR
ncbi:MAG: cadherin-like beta sandwich domain-containing protein [Mariniphaga sp.]|nr:cadherin-like beta sandwich domain-containing protein [Mariniphaga sp.]